MTMESYLLHQMMQVITTIIIETMTMKMMREGHMD